MSLDETEGRAVLAGWLRDRDWLEGEGATIADVACYSYVALADEGGVALGAYPAVCAWVERFADLPAYQTMPGLEIP
jgi:glutathione S-transferase